MKNTKAQFWYGDFLIAVLILMIIGLLFATSIRDITSRNEVIKELILDASDISSVLMSEGYGEDWKNNKGTIGLITNYRLDTNKFYRFLLGLDYNQQKSMLGTYNNVWIYLKDKDGNLVDSNSDRIQEELGGDLIESINNIDADNLVHIKRFIFHEDEIHTLGVVVW